MVSVINRMRVLRALLTVRIGAGAAVLPPEVTKINMSFAFRGNEGHFGPRKFWRECLPRLKFHNPTVSMTVNRTEDNSAPALMTIYFNEKGSTRKEEIDMKNRHSSHILSYLLDVTRAKEIQATEADMKLAEELAEQQKKSEEDSRKCKEINAERKRQEAIVNASRKQMEEMNVD